VSVAKGRASAARPAPAPEPALVSCAPTQKRAVLGRSEPHASAPQSLRGRALCTLLDLPDARLVPIALSGDQLALEALYRKHSSFAIHLATRIEGSSRDVEDVVHDAFIKAFSRLADLADPAAFRSWLGSIVVFAVRSRLRRARLMSLLGLGRGAEPVDLDSIASSEASPHTRAQLAQIYALLRTLPTDERIGWTLRYVAGHELDVVAKLTGCSLATVKRKIGKAQKFLEEHFVDSAAAFSEPPPAPDGTATNPPSDDVVTDGRSDCSRSGTRDLPVKLVNAGAHAQSGKVGSGS